MRELHHVVQEDLLGLPNRRRMHEAIDAALEQVRAGREPAAVLLIEVCGLDAAGPEVAAGLASRLTAVVGADDLVTRFGGDVIVVVAGAVSDEFAAHALAQRLGDAVDSAGGDAAPLRASVGVALVRETDASVSAVVARADAAMYAARNKASRDARGDAARPREDSREALVEAAFERSTVQDFDVYYQPIADLNGGSVAAVEAILRWEHPDLGTIAPAEFLAIAQRRGQLVTLGRWTIEKACAQTVRWAATRDGLPMRTCVNIAPAHAADPAFLEDVMSSLARSGATGHQLAFELTEEALAALPPDLHGELARQRIELVLDHAGTSAPSHEHLAELPIARIKFDRSLVATDAAGPSPPLRAAAELARSLGLPAVAKGVETREQLAAVRECGVRFAQGYLFSHPHSAAAIEQLVYRERPFASLLAPPPVLFGGLELDGDEPAVEIGAPAVP
jgi:diguanylate cyclase (GGDEF)-like protein